jgi:hypothetical protein
MTYLSNLRKYPHIATSRKIVARISLIYSESAVVTAYARADEYPKE